MDTTIFVLVGLLLILLVVVKVLWNKVLELKKTNCETIRINTQMREVLRDAGDAFLQQELSKVKNMIADACLKDRDVLPLRTVAQYLDEVLRSKQRGESCKNSSRLSVGMHIDDVME